MATAVVAMPNAAMDTMEENKPKVDNRPWVERYRPANLDAVSHQAHVVSVLKNAVATGRLPHLLLYGPPGSGKTSVALALCRQLWSPTEWKRRVLELNASDERGISVVREKIKQFASFSVSKASTKSTKSFFTQGKENKNDDTTPSSSQYPNPAFKIIILDEADTVTKDAQSALRRIIEATSHTTRFILICNYVTRIIAPLGSRCAKFRFAALPADAMRERLCSIAQAEKENACSTDDNDAAMQEDADGTNALVDSVLQHAGGDMRKAVMLLQSLHSLGGTSDACSDEVVADICGVPPTSVSTAVWTELCAATTFAAVQRCLEDYCAAGYAARACLTHWLEQLEDEDSNALLSEVHKSDVAIRIAEAEANMIQGADEGLQLLTVGSLLHECLAQHKKATAAAAS